MNFFLYCWRCLRSGSSHMTKSFYVIRLVRTQTTGKPFLQSSNTDNENNRYFDTMVLKVASITITPICPYMSMISLYHGICIPNTKDKSTTSLFSCQMKRHLDSLKLTFLHYQSHYSNVTIHPSSMYSHIKQYP